MSGRYLLDTNIIIALFANDIEVNNQLVNAEEIFIPSVAIGELFYGAKKSGRSQGNLERINSPQSLMPKLSMFVLKWL
ncbi:MAG: PIN domain-containing protein [Nostoc indistinguendum CM1-VF10]|jgi:tRNA(fMet)-specific endonuclease VapC|nr:PIN domain-containing protein [Nostoc indistinguendum CM1-VF10]